MRLSSSGVAGERRGAGGRIDHERRHFDGGRTVAGEPPQERADACVDLLGRERFHDVLVGARVEQPDDLLLAVARRTDDHRHAAHRAHHLEQISAVDVGEAEVEDDDLGRFVDDRLQRGQAERRLVDPVPARGEGTDERDADAIVILHDEHSRHGSQGKARPPGDRASEQEI